MQNNVGIYASQISGHLWAPNGAMDALATITVGSTSVSSVTFSGIPQGYKHLQVRYIGRGDANGNATFRFNGDTGSNYAYHILYGNGSSALATAGANNSFIYLGNINASAPDAGVIDILDYSSTTKNKTAKILCGTDTNSGGEVGLFSGSWFPSTPAAITSITFSFTNFAQYSQFALYGVK